MRALLRRFGLRVPGSDEQDPLMMRVRIQALLTVLLIGTNVIGAVVVVLMNYVIIPGGGPSPDLVRALVIAVPAYVVAAVIVGTLFITRLTLRELGWALNDQSPQEPSRPLPA